MFLSLNFAGLRNVRFVVMQPVLLGFLVLCSALPAAAGPFSISPVRIYMAPRERATAITVTNEGDEPLVMQADIYDWKQKANGEDDLVLTEDMIVSPPIIKVAPKSRQVVRLAMLRPRPSGEQLTYRLIVREIPEAKPAGTNVQLQIALAFSMPVFITPNGVKRNVACTTERAADAVKAVCENTGNAFAQPRSFELTSVDGGKLASTDTGGYILPGVKRGFELKNVGGKVPAGKAKLTVTHDDSANQTFEVNIIE
jgi:fimbrial chaperone protein